MPDKLLADVTILDAGSLTRICYYSAGSDKAAPSQPPVAAPAVADVEHLRSPEALAKWLVTHSGIGEWSAFCVARTLLADSSPFRLSLSDPVPAGQGDGAYFPGALAGFNLLGWIAGYYGAQMPSGVAARLIVLAREWSATPSPAMPSGIGSSQESGRTAYRAYCSQVEEDSERQPRMPLWADLSAEAKRCWAATENALLTARPTEAHPADPIPAAGQGDGAGDHPQPDVTELTPEDISCGPATLNDGFARNICAKIQYLAVLDRNFSEPEKTRNEIFGGLLVLLECIIHLVDRRIDTLHRIEDNDEIELLSDPLRYLGNAVQKAMDWRRIEPYNEGSVAEVSPVGEQVSDVEHKEKLA